MDTDWRNDSNLIPKRLLHGYRRRHGLEKKQPENAKHDYQLNDNQQP